MNENFRLSDIVIFSLDESASQPASPVAMAIILT